jgi:hypothetical protein
MYDRRIVAPVSLSIALAGATALTVLAWLALVTPEILLAARRELRWQHQPFGSLTRGSQCRENRRNHLGRTG